MPRTFVALDLETTGLNPERDAIIEVAAVKFRDDEPVDRFTTLINPGRPIPHEIQQLTGISNADVLGKPRFDLIAPQLTRFVGSLPVVGHNVSFDLGFLRPHGLLTDNLPLDTWELATILLPNQAGYSLGVLADRFALAMPSKHRALDDATATGNLFLVLGDRVSQLPRAVLLEIGRLARGSGWPLGQVFEEALIAAGVVKGAAEEISLAELAPGSPLFQPWRAGEALAPVEQPTPVDVAALAAMLKPGGAVGQAFPGYEFRPPQVAMLEAVANAFNRNHHLFAEAGTGTGKCLTGDTWITFQGGQRRQIRELCESNIPPSAPILCVTPAGRLTHQRILAIHPNGIQPVWRIRTALGRTITATGNHPFLTVEGWRHLSELTTGQRIATLRCLAPGEKHLAWHEAFVAGAMLGDGGCVRQDSLDFTNFDPAVAAAVQQSVAKLGNVRMVPKKAKGHYGFQRLSILKHERSGLSLLLERLDILGCNARTKHIPAVFFEADAETISVLLAGLWVTDGSIETRDGHPSIASASESLISEIQHLLLRLGIIARQRYKAVQLHSKCFDSWSLVISDLESKRIFRQTIGKHLIGQKRERLESWWTEHAAQQFNPNDDLIPASTWRMVDHERQRATRSWNVIRGTCIVSSDRTREISRAKMKAMGEFLGSSALVDLATSDLYWDRIVAIEPAGEAVTYDLTMEGAPNFVANDIVVHNSLAYLLPAIAYATQNGSRVVVSTNTINLQDQLFKKDLPDLQQILAGAWGQETPFRATLLKGRSNYLCPRRFAALKARPRLNHDELRVIARILVWLPTTQTGDQSELSLPQPSDRFVWSQVAADNEGCSLDRCQRDMGGRCFFFRARKQAEASHIVVVNHALLMADAATDYRVLPEYKHLIIDEAHHLEDAVTDQLSFRADSGSLSQLFTALYGRGGRAGAAGPPAEERVVPVFGQPIRSSGRGKTGQPVRAAGSRAAYPPGQLGEIAALLDLRVAPEFAAPARDLLLRLQADIEAVHLRLEDFWTVLNEAMAALQPQADNSEYDVRIRITSATRNQPVWVEIEVSWENLALTWQQASKRLAALEGGLQDLQKTADAPARLDDLLEDLANTERRLAELYSQMEAWVVRPESNGIYWVEIGRESGPGRRVTLRTAPLHVGPLVQQHVLFHNDTVILTSATLRTAGSFEYLRDRLAAAEADTVAVGSPFDYRESTLLYLPSDLPEPNAPTYQTAVEQALVALAKALGGRTLALFTSYAQLRRTRDAILPALREAGVEVLSQGGGTSRHQLLEAFKTGSRTILLGTRSFWEGVDVVGPALSALVLVRLPFAVPSDPIVAARSETFDDAFYHYSVPDAILRFRQGFGRLIRSKTDRGVVVVLDKRVQSKSYGQLFLDSLPECTVHKGPLMNLPAAARRWVDGA